MGSVAAALQNRGYTITGSDQNVYPPMSDFLIENNINVSVGHDENNIPDKVDLVVIGNAMSRGNVEVESVLNRKIPYTSLPELIKRYFLQGKRNIVITGTHGKTTTSSIIAHLLNDNGLNPNLMIGGIPLDIGEGGRFTESEFFVIEGDEYDTAFFDKRSKFVHYMPEIVVVNNIEFDHADIFDNVEAIERQFHHLVRTVPSQGLIVRPALDRHLDNALEMGCWSPVQDTAIGSEISRTADWRAELLAEDGSRFMVIHHEQPVATLKWGLTGLHNVRNALSAIAAARHVGVTPDHAVAALCRFSGVKRRMELVGEIGGVRVYDDFAHHPTAIASTLEGLRNRVGDEPILAIIEPRSNTMKQGVHKQTLIPSAALADRVLWGNLSDMDWLPELVGSWQAEHGELDHHRVEASVEELIEKALEGLPETCHIVIMSNGGFGGIHRKLVAELEKRRG